MRFIALVLVVCLGIFFHGCQGSDYIVDKIGGLKYAIQAANDGDVLVIPTGVYSGDNNTFLFLYGRNFTFTSQSGNPNDVTIDCHDKYNVILVTLYETTNTSVDKPTNLAFYGITFRNCVENGGGAMYFYTAGITATTSVTISDCVFHNNVADVGGAIYASAGGPINLAISASTFYSNSADFAGAIYVAATYAVIINSQFFDNEASEAGGAMYVDELSTVVIINSNIFLNTAVEDGGAIYFYNNSFLQLQGTTFKQNTAVTGGAILVDTTQLVSATACDFLYNTAAVGGGIFLNAGTITINNSHLIGNTAYAAEHDGGGGAVCAFTGSYVYIYNSNLTGNHGDLGGAIALDESTFTFQSDTVNNNYASEGGAFYLQDEGTLFVSYSSVVNNSASKGDTVYCNESSITFTQTVILTHTNRSSETNGVACAESVVNTTRNSCAIQASGSGNWNNVCIHLDDGSSSAVPDKSGGGSGDLAGWKVITIIVVFSVVGAVVIGLIIAAFIIKSPTAFAKFK